MIGFTFPHEHKDVIQKATVIQKCDDSDSYYLIDLMDGSRATIEYNLLLEKFNSSDEDGDQIFTFSGISGHQKVKGNKFEVRVEWDGVGYKPTWEPLGNLKHADPITLAQYAKDNNLLDTPGWKWAKRSILTMDSGRLICLSRRICKATRNDEFGV